MWPSLSSTSQQFGIEILHKVCLAYENPFVMVWLIILRDMFILNCYYLMWIDIDFFCAYTYVVGHLVARLSCWVLSSKSQQRFFFQPNKMSWVDVACYNIGSFFLFKFASEETKLACFVLHCRYECISSIDCIDGPIQTFISMLSPHPSWSLNVVLGIFIKGLT